MSASDPRVETFPALCRVLGFGLKIVPLDELGQEPDGAAAIEKRPKWARRLREEIRRDLVEVVGHADQGGSCTVEQSGVGSQRIPWMSR